VRFNGCVFLASHNALDYRWPKKVEGFWD